MKVSEKWLREWVNPPASREELAHQLTMAGLEVDQITDEGFELSITPNRGDCLSIAGIAREVAVMNRLPYTAQPSVTTAASISDALPITISSPIDCPHYAGRIIRGINSHAQTPEWMKERLIESGIEPILTIVDITNYVLMELGQPLHAFDLNRLSGDIWVRRAKKDESLTLLNGQAVKLVDDTLVIADDKQPVAIAGVMGGLDSAITAVSTDIFLESAFFNPIAIVGRARRYGLQTDSAYRFERGVDPALQVRAIERATELILEIAGGQAGPIMIVKSVEHLPSLRTILLRSARIERILGMSLPAQEIETILQSLGMKLTSVPEGWQVIPPSYRFDIEIEADLIEEIVRIHGYDRVPTHSMTNNTSSTQSEVQISITTIRDTMIHRGYQEAITYSFVDPKLEALLAPELSPLSLVNPISPELSVMRTSLWPGLLTALKYNLNRQQSRIRLFEIGLRFIPLSSDLNESPVASSDETARAIDQHIPALDGLLSQQETHLSSSSYLKQENILSGVITGPVYSEQWGLKSQSVDFYDIKNDLEALFALTGELQDFIVEPVSHAAFHSGQASRIVYKGRVVGLLGKIHPALAQTLDVGKETYMFELTLDNITTALLPSYKTLAKFPSMRRDLAILIDRTISASQIKEVIFQTNIQFLKEVLLFDVYQGKGIDPDKKSVALGLIFQHPTRTLTDTEVNEQLAQVVHTLETTLLAVLRSTG